MGDNMINTDRTSNFSYISQNQTVANMSVVPQLSARPNTLPINVQRGNNPSLFTPNDYNKLYLSTPEMDDRLRGYTTPDLINALTQPMHETQPSPGVKTLDELVTVHHHNQQIMPTQMPYDQVSYKIVSNTDNVKNENHLNYHFNQTNTPTLSRNRSISSSMNDNESSNSTAPSSPLSSSHIHLKRVKDELQHVPTMHGSSHDGQNDLVKREKKRERNRQAAQKCRTRKLTRIAELQKRVNALQGKNKDLTGIADCLKTDITRLEKQLQDHHTQGCTLMNGSVL